MTKTIKISLIILGFIILCVLKFISDSIKYPGLYVIAAIAYLAYCRGVWRYKKSPNDTLDKS